MSVDQRVRRALLLAVAVLMGAGGCGGSPPEQTPVDALPAVAPTDAEFVSPSAAAPTPSPSAAVSSPAPSRRPSASPSAVRTSPKAALPANDASRLRTLPSGTTQVVIVQAPSASATVATLQAYTKTSAGWQPALSAVGVHIGGNGFSAGKQEGDRTTPIGVFGFDATMYGIAANPGVHYAYHQLVADDWWDENSASPGYNTFHHGVSPGGPSEALWQVSPQYTYFAVIRYNMPATAGRGSGIFLHQSSGNSTLGCVSLPQSDLVSLLTWLNPKANPRIVLAPTAQLSHF